MITVSEIAVSLQKSRSKQAVIALVERMAKENFSFTDYLDLIASSEMPLRWHLSWTLSHYLVSYPFLSPSNQSRLWEFLKTEREQGVLRDVWKSFSVLDIDEDIAGDVYDRGLQVLVSPALPTAVRVHALQCAFNIAKDYSELKQELALQLEEVKGLEDSGMLARVKKLYAALNKD